MGQMFYSMSLAMGIMITYGSYTRDDVSLVKSVNQIEIFDTIIALLAGLMVIPAVYVFSGEAGMSSGGAGLMFITLPKIFTQMKGGVILGFLFFVLVFFAAITSSVSVMEAITSMLMDKYKISRLKSCMIIFVICIFIDNHITSWCLTLNSISILKHRTCWSFFIFIATICIPTLWLSIIVS